MFRLLPPAIAALALGGCMGDPGPATDTAGGGRYTITGDLSAVYATGDFVLWAPDPKEDDSYSPGVVLLTSASGEESTRDSLRNSLNIIAEAAIVNGRFFLEGRVRTPRNVFFYIFDGAGRDGLKTGSFRGQSFVLEPDDLRMVMDGQAKIVVEGGHYNDIVVNSWRLSPEYREVYAEYNLSLKEVEGESAAQRLARSEQSGAVFNQLLWMESEGRGEVALNHEDPLARKLTLQSTWLRGRWYEDAVRKLAEMMPEDPWVISSLAAEEEYAAARSQAGAIAVGADVRDFEAETLDGETVSVSGACAGKEVLLLEFWASWCGPCRVEIPHMKQAYSRYGPRGFEILSFTVDDLREDWAAASEEEDLPWINSGMGIDHPATEAYGVTGVPANFLVDAASGRVLAKNLRGRKLDEALEERFAKPDSS